MFSDVIGILGGMGSFSTLYIFNKLLDSTPATEEFLRPRIIIDNNCTLPSKTDAILRNRNRYELVNKIIGSLEGLISMGCTKLIIVCYLVHSLKHEICSQHQEIENALVDILDCTFSYMARNNIIKIGLLASKNTISSRVFSEYALKYQIEVVYDELLEAAFRETALRGEYNDTSADSANRLLQLCLQYNDLPVLLGCTELSQIYGKNTEMFSHLHVIDPIDIVVNELLRRLK